MGLLASRRSFTVADLAEELRLGPDGLAPYDEMLQAMERLAV
jgi:hypothetical protein